MSKGNQQSPLDKLPENQQAALEEWLFERTARARADGTSEVRTDTYDEALERLHLDFNVRSSRAALGRFYRRVSQRRLLESITRNAAKANEIEDAFQKNAAPVPQAVVKLVTQLAFEEITKGADLDKDFIVKLTKLAVDSGLKAKKLELDERKVSLLEAKAKQAEDAEKAMGDTKLSPEEKQQKLRQIFGMS